MSHSGLYIIVTKTTTLLYCKRNCMIQLALLIIIALVTSITNEMFVHLFFIWISFRMDFLLTVYTRSFSLTFLLALFFLWIIFA